MSEKLVLTETHHAGVIAAFYRELTQLCGKGRGTEIFLTAARAYGARRGRRMAMRALRDGNPLDIRSYFYYGELIFGNPEERKKASFADVAGGAVHQCVLSCGWAKEFRDTGYPECGVVYCREIDTSIVRGFNPGLSFESPNNLNSSDRCDFYFRGPEVLSDFFETYSTSLKPGRPVRHEMGYHCADLWQMFCRIVTNVLPQEADKVISGAAVFLEGRYGTGFCKSLEAYSGENFDDIA